jgi:hypothetical protein
VNPYGETVTALRALVDKTEELIAQLKSTGRLRECFSLPALTQARAQLASLEKLSGIVTTSVAIGNGPEAACQLGKDLVTHAVVVLEDWMTPQQVAELLCGTVSAGAGYLAVLCGADRAEAMLKALPAITRNAAVDYNEQQTRH